MYSLVIQPFAAKRMMLQSMSNPNKIRKTAIGAAFEVPEKYVRIKDLFTP